MRWVLLSVWLLSGSLLGLGCEEDEEGPALTGDFDEVFEGLRVEHGLAALNVGKLQGGRLVRVGAYGVADTRSGAAATPDTLYSLASVSKVFVGLAIARAIELGFGLDLDADVNDYLGFAAPLRHPRFPDAPVTLRQLVRHRSGIVTDGEDDYDTYPRPDPTTPLGGFLEGFLAQPGSWTAQAPGAAEEYSNMGTALAALVVEAAVGQPFEAFCNVEIFSPLGMDDTRWFYRQLSGSQRARLARPQGEDGPLEHYGFPDWPSGQLRSTVGDLARAMTALMGGGGPLLSRANLALFHEVPLFIVREGGRFSHSGGETGVNTYIEYDTAGDGLIILTNQDLEDDALEAAFEDLETALRVWSPRP